MHQIVHWRANHHIITIFEGVRLCRINNCDAIILDFILRHGVFIIRWLEWCVSMLERDAFDLIPLELLEVLGHSDMLKHSFNVLSQYLLCTALSLVKLVPRPFHLFNDIV